MLDISIIIKRITFAAFMIASFILTACGDSESTSELNNVLNPSLAAKTSVPADKNWQFTDSRPKTYEVNPEQERRILNELPIRNKIRGKPPRPQPYTVIYIMDRFVLVCEYSDDTGELFYCDLYS